MIISRSTLSERVLRTISRKDLERKMKITNVESIMLRLPQVQRIGDGAQTLLLVKVQTDEGIVGIGEVHTSELAAKAVIEMPFSSWSTIGLAEIITGRDPFEIGLLWDEMYKYTTGYGRRGIVLHAISAIDMALWDILGKATGMPIYQLLGGARQKQIDLYASDLDPGDHQQRVELALRHTESGFRAVKMGWGGLGGDIHADADAIGAIRDKVGPSVDLMLDVGLGMPIADAVRFTELLSDHDLFFLEEPLEADDFDGFRDLVSASRVPIASGEKLATVRDFNDLMVRGNLRIIQPDLARVGGFSEMMRIIHHAEARGVLVIPHCWASDILVAGSLHVMAVLRNPKYLEFNVREQPLRSQLVTEPIRHTSGTVPVPEKPGLGVEINEEIVSKYCVA